MDFADVATRIASRLVEAALVESDRESAARAMVLATLRESPPDLKVPYEEARHIALGDLPPDTERPK